MTIQPAEIPMEGTPLIRPSTTDHPLYDQVVEACRSVYDPEIPVNIFDLGLVYTIEIRDDGDVDIAMTLTAPGCPVAGEMPGWVMEAVGAVPGVQPFDRTFVILATAASVEAIFLSTFVLISQNRAARAADRQAALDLQINLLTEHEVTRLIALTTAIANKLNVHEAQEPDLAELKRDVAPEAVLDTLERQSND